MAENKELYFGLAKSDVIREIQAYFYRVPAEKRYTLPTITSDTTGQVVQRVSRPGYLGCCQEFLQSLEFFEISIVEVLLYKKGSLTSFAEYYTFNNSVNGKQIIPFAIEKDQMTNLIVKINGMSEEARIDMATFDILKDIDSLKIKIRKTLNKYSLSADDLEIDDEDINIFK